jgi:glycosyltransferase involved in cell wall biosynthesis
MHVLWMASWYPDPYENKNGDFIQRHAKAVAKLLPVDVVHVVQSGSAVATKQGSIHTKENNLREFIFSFNYKPWGISRIDKIRYNIKYQLFYNRLLDNYFKQYGVPDLIHVHAPMKAGVIARKIASHWHIPYIISDHSSMYDINAVDHFNSRSLYFKKQLAKVYKKATASINVSNAMAAKAEELFQVKNTLIIRNVTDTSLFYFSEKNDTGIFRWIHVSTLYPLKNVQKIIKAFSNIDSIQSNWQLIIVGGANEALKQFVNEKGLAQKILFTGELTYDAVAKEMQRASAMVMFSKHENFPCAIIEALCCGLPVVTSNVGGISEAVDSTNGILVENENLPALQAAILKMMQNYSYYHPKQIAADASDRYSEEIIGNKFIQLYKNLLSGHK